MDGIYKGEVSRSLQDLSRRWGEYAAELRASNRILVVDDEPGVLKLFGAILSRKNFDCSFAESGEQALEVFNNGGFDGMLVDKNLPGIDGLELIRRVHQVDKDCEAVIVTGYASLDSALSAIDLGAADYLTKPLPNIGILPATLTKILRRRKRRLLVRRMVDDLRQAANVRAQGEDWSLVLAARRRIEAFRNSLQRRRVIMFADEKVTEILPVAEFLAVAGYSVPLVRTGAETVQRASNGEANVVVIGDTLADMSGIDLFERMLAVAARPEIIVISDRVGLQDVISALSRGAFGFAVKPITDHEVFARTIERACMEHLERLMHFKVVNELRTVVDALAKREVHQDVRREIQGALQGFSTETAQVALRIYESEAGESAWGSDSDG